MNPLPLLASHLQAAPNSRIQSVDYFGYYSELHRHGWKQGIERGLRDFQAAAGRTAPPLPPENSACASTSVSPTAGELRGCMVCGRTIRPPKSRYSHRWESMELFYDLYGTMRDWQRCLRFGACSYQLKIERPLQSICSREDAMHQR